MNDASTQGPLPGEARRADHLAARARLGGSVPRGPVGNVFRRLGRIVVLGLANLLLPRPRGRIPESGDLRRVLVVRLDERVGNQLLTTPLLRALKLGLPASEIHLLAPRQGHLVACPHVDRAILWQKRDAFRAPVRFVKGLFALRRARYDVVIEAGHWSSFSLTASVVARFVSTRRGAVVGHDRGAADHFLSHPVPHDPSVVSEVPAKLELIRPFGFPARGLEPETGLGQEEGASADTLLGSLGLGGKPLAVVNPGARFADRRWSPSSYAAVCRGLSSRGFAPLVVWGPGEDTLAREIAAGAGVVLAPATGLGLLAALMRRARLVVSNNSGPMHLAVALGRPTVGVFFRNDAARWGHDLPTFAAASIRGDDAEAVLEACDRLLPREK